MICAFNLTIVCFVFDYCETSVSYSYRWHDPVIQVTPVVLDFLWVFDLKSLLSGFFDINVIVHVNSAVRLIR